MSLPELLMPPSLPPFKASSFQITPPDLYGQVARSGGGGRRRRIYRTAPTLVSAELETTQAGLEDFYNWYEGPLGAGSKPFSAMVAKIGAGVEWWRAYIVGPYKAEHRDGEGSHVISFQLRLEGSAQPTGPTSAPLQAEVTVPLYIVYTGASSPSELSASVACPLSFFVNVGAALAAEIRVALAAEHAGPGAENVLGAEISCGLQFEAVVLPGATFAAEVAVPLTALHLDFAQFAAEVSVALVLTHEAATGPVTPVGTFFVSNFSDFSPGGYAAATVRVENNGGYYGRERDQGYYLLAQWWDPLGAGVGAGRWVRATTASPSLLTGSATGVWLDLSTSREWRLQRQAQGNSTVNIDLEVAADPDGANIISSYSGTLEAEYAT
jgi:hypothetical protein